MGTKGKESFEDFVRKSLTSLNDNLETKFNAMNTKLEDMNKSIEDVATKQSDIARRVSDLEQSMPKDIDSKFKEVTDSLEFESSRISDNVVKNNEFKTELESHKSEMAAAMTRIERLELECLSLERHSRSFNIRVLGVPESEVEVTRDANGRKINPEDCREIVENILQDNFDMQHPGPYLEVAHRTGIKQTNNPRPIIARFFSREDRLSVMREARESLKNTSYRFVDDHAKKDFLEKQRIQPYIKFLYDNGKRPRYTKGKLYSNGKFVNMSVVNDFLARHPPPQVETEKRDA